MTLPDDITRYLWLRDSGVELPDDPIDLLRRVNDLARRLLPNSLAQENTKLKSQLAEAESRVSEALGKARVLETKITMLEAAAKRQTLVRPHDHLMRRDSSSSTSEFGPDQLVDDSFVPCRDERCKVAGLHAANSGQCNNSRGPGRKKKDSHA